MQELHEKEDVELLLDELPPLKWNKSLNMYKYWPSNKITPPQIFKMKYGNVEQQTQSYTVYLELQLCHLQISVVFSYV